MTWSSDGIQFTVRKTDYARVVIVVRTTEWRLVLADQGGPVDSTVQLL